MQQHSGQHILSAAFVEVLQMPTVSFHMGDESCTIDLDTRGLTPEQVRRAEQRANEIILEDRPVSTEFVSQDKAREMGLRKLPPAERDQLRLINIDRFDVCACGGTHVRSTGQVGVILCRKIEKVKQGFRVEFVCGERAVHLTFHYVKNRTALFLDDLAHPQFGKETFSLFIERFQFEPPGVENLPATRWIERRAVEYNGSSPVGRLANAFERSDEVVEKRIVVVEAVGHVGCSAA